jgi:hypothetical protein
MDHADALELIEIGAAEPGGLERLAAGDTPESSLVAGHLAGCPTCADALVRIARTAGLARTAIRELPDPALRERTLAFVREVGRDRSGVVAAPASVVGARSGGSGPVFAPEPAALIPDAAEASTAMSIALSPVVSLAARRSRRPWLAVGLAAAVVVAAVLGFAAGGALRPAGNRAEDVANAAAVIRATMRIAVRPDAARIVLASANGGTATGSVIYSAASGELAMVETGLAPAPDGAVYACWVESGGMRRRIGVVYEEGGTGSWAGPVTGLDALAPGSTFGVSLVPAGSQTGTPVLTRSSSGRAPRREHERVPI